MDLISCVVTHFFSQEHVLKACESQEKVCKLDLMFSIRVSLCHHLYSHTELYIKTLCLFSLLPSDRTCNPSLLSIFQQIAVSTPAPLEIENQTAVVIIGTEEPVLTAPYLQWWDAQSIVGLAIFVLCILYSR